MSKKNNSTSIRKYCNIPKNEIPLYVVSYDPVEDAFHTRNDVSEEGIVNSAESLPYFIKLLCDEAGICALDFLNIIREEIVKNPQNDCKNCSTYKNKFKD